MSQQTSQSCHIVVAGWTSYALITPFDSSSKQNWTIQLMVSRGPRVDANAQAHDLPRPGKYSNSLVSLKTILHT
eukprot:5137347-Amphidinium_carterae.1